MEEKDILNEIEFCLFGEYITLEHEQAIQKLVELYKNEKETSHFLQNKLDEANAKTTELNKMIDEMAEFYAKGNTIRGTKEQIIEEFKKKVRDEE